MGRKDLKKSRQAGVGIPAREWYSISNKAINYIFQTFRYRNLCLLMTTPSFDFLDSQTRKLFHVYIETQRIDYATNRVVCKVFENQFNPRTGEIYRKYFWTDGVKKERINIGKPTKDMIKDYEELKHKFSEKLESGVEKDVKRVIEKEAKARLTDEEIQNEMKKRKEKGERLTIPEAQRIYGIGHDRAAFNIYAVWGKRRKGMWAKEDGEKENNNIVIDKQEV